MFSLAFGCAQWSSSLHRVSDVNVDTTRTGVRIENTIEKRKPRKRPSGTRVVRRTPPPPPPVNTDFCGHIDALEVLRTCGTDEDVTTRRTARTTIETEIRRATRTIGVPALIAKTQPATSALINIPTIYYTHAATHTRDVTLLGQTIRIEATPASYTWHHGDGTKQATRNPGRPHPNKDITHTYTQPAASVNIRVDTTYRIRYRLPDGSWHSLPETLTPTGPTTTLSIHEARPYLTANRR